MSRVDSASSSEAILSLNLVFRRGKYIISGRGLWTRSSDAFIATGTEGGRVEPRQNRKSISEKLAQGQDRIGSRGCSIRLEHPVLC